MTDAQLSAFDHAQSRGFALLKRVVDGLEPGMSERDIADLSESEAVDAGFDGWFHPPEVQIGDRIRSNHIWKTPSAANRLTTGDLVCIDLGPATGDAYADVGTTVSFGIAEPPVVEVARECVRGTVGFGSQWKTVGELFIFARAWANNHRMTLHSTRSIGHAILPAEGWVQTGFPRSAHAATWLRRYQIRRLNPVRLDGLWAVRPLVTDGQTAAAFEEVFYVNGPDKRILGRASLDEVGTL